VLFTALRYKEGGWPGWPKTRDAQLAALALPYTGVGSAQDLGDEKSGLGAVHPRNKTILGERLALNALHQIYGRDVVYQGPTFADITWPLDGQAVQTVILRFHPSEPWNAGLQLLDTSGCDLCCASLERSAITVVTSDNVIRRAEVTVVADAFVVLATVQLTSPQLRVVSVQHNWEEYPQCALYNAARLPHLPLNVTRP
jgi:sialate O-acetylesterase